MVGLDLQRKRESRTIFEYEFTGTGDDGVNVDSYRLLESLAVPFDSK